MSGLARRWPVVLVAVALGVLIGLGGFTFRYAEGLSYFSHDPRACANCHIMQRQYDGWQKASHHAAATCVDCHLPDALVPKLFAKASNGRHHSKGFTLQDFAEPIRIKPPNSKILEQNCRRCHQALLHDAIAGAREDGVACVHCHASVGHGEAAGLGGPPEGEDDDQ